MSDQFNGPGSYDPECTALREQLSAEGVVLIVRNGVKGDGFEVQLNALDLVALPSALRQIADQVEAQLMGGPGPSAARPEPEVARALAKQLRATADALEKEAGS